MYFSIDQIQKALAKKRYLFFDKERPYMLNIIGIRNSNTTSKPFNDSLYLIYRDDNLNPLMYRFEVSTTPENYHLKTSQNGNVVLMPGQYIGSHQIGSYKKKYEVLIQKTPVRVVLYNDCSTTAGPGSKSHEGMFEVNICSSHQQVEPQVIEKRFSGSTVFKKAADFNFFMDICRKARIIHENSFTYTLLREEDFLQ